MNTWLMKGYFDTIRKELDESARMDGAGHFRIFLANHYATCKANRSGCSVIYFHRPIYRFYFSEYYFAHTRKLYVSSWIIEMVAKKFGNEFTTFAAGSVLIAIPISILFLSLQKYFISGLTAGGTKG